MKIGVGIGLSYPKYTTFVNRGGQTSPFHPSLVDYWNFKGKSNFDKDRNTIKGIKGEILTAYNFGWSLGSGYGLFKENYNSYLKWDGTRAVFTNTDSSIHITESLIIEGFIKSNNDRIINAYSVEIKGLKPGISLEYVYIDQNSLMQKKMPITDDGIYNIPKAGNGFNGFKFVDYVGPCDITIQQIPEYEGAIVTDGIDDYLKLDKIGYKIGTVILKYTTLFRDNNWRYVFDVQKERAYLASNKETGVFVTSMQYKFAGDYMYLIPRTSNNPTTSNTPLYIGSNSIVTESVRMALYDIAIYEDILTDEEIYKEIKVMEYGTPNPVFALNFDNFAYKAVDYPEFATGKVTTNKIVVNSTTETFNGAIAVAMNPEVTTGDAIEIPAYKLKISGFNDYNLPESSFGVAILASNISGGSEYIAETPALDGVYDVPSIALSDGIFNLAIVTQIAIDKPIEIEVLYDSSITTNFPNVKQIFR